jgi:hypothetical protein
VFPSDHVVEDHADHAQIWGTRLGVWGVKNNLCLPPEEACGRSKRVGRRTAYIVTALTASGLANRAK